MRFGVRVSFGVRVIGRVIGRVSFIMGVNVIVRVATGEGGY